MKKYDLVVYPFYLTIMLTWNNHPLLRTTLYL